MVDYSLEKAKPNSHSKIFYIRNKYKHIYDTCVPRAASICKICESQM